MDLCFIFTLLRDQVDKVVSLFNYYMNKDWDTCLFEEKSITSVCNNMLGHRDWVVKFLSVVSTKVFVPRAGGNYTIKKLTEYRIVYRTRVIYD